MLILGTISVMGCATKGYVRSQVQPVNAKVDQVSKSTDAQFKQTNGKLDQTSQQVQTNQTNIAANKEAAASASSTANEALNRVNQTQGQLNDLNNTVANLDAYKLTDHAVVLFGFNRHNLTAAAKAQLDKVASDIQGEQRYFITVTGYTDQIGPTSYNDVLSRERAESVIRYLVGEHDIPIYRIHMVGLGKMHLVNGGRTLQDRKESRRVDIGVYVAPPLPAAKSGGTE
jgi:outer membrane protein OmpA-like peptidoglycan-associated protein